MDPWIHLSSQVLQESNIIELQNIIDLFLFSLLLQGHFTLSA